METNRLEMVNISFFSTFFVGATCYNDFGDTMIKKYVAPVLTCIGIGVCLGIFFFQQYNPKENPSQPVGTEVEEVITFLQLGVYSNEASMKENLKNLSYYTYLIEDSKYYVFGGMTKTKENVDKIKGYYQSLGYDSYAKEYKIKSTAFSEVLGQYDLMLKETQDQKTIGAICNQVIAKYEELIGDVKNEGSTS